MLLAGVAALRAGAGKLQLATVREAAIQLGLSVPESLVVALPATKRGAISGAAAAGILREYAAVVDAVLIGPGMVEDRSAGQLVNGVVAAMKDDAVIVLDAGGLAPLNGTMSLLTSLDGRALITPHAGEMATLLGIDKSEVDADPRGVAQDAAARLGCVVALKGAETWIATPDGELFHFTGGAVGLATSGSGDTLAGIAVGLAARGASPLVAAIWSVWAHAAAGDVLARRMARVGFLARELLAEIPALISARRPRA
jgi:hydroxyethylthiazole kinase-like uncharacterized protein yjeF